LRGRRRGQALGGLASWQPVRRGGRLILFFFFILTKTCLREANAEPQRNCGLIGLTFRRGGLAWRLCGFAAWPAELRGALFFSSRKAHP